MKIKTLLAATIAVAGLGVTLDAQAQEKHGYRHGGRHGHGHHWHGPRLGFYFGAPLLLGSWYWHDPYWYGPRTVYREVIREPEVVEVERIEREVPAAPAPRGEGVPAQGPLYMNYCESAKAYFPKVQKCPEGWKFISPTQ